jgi:hypothetical protein
MTGTGSLGLGCGVGDCCMGGFSSATSGADIVCASSDALVRLLRCTGWTLGSLGSAGLRGFLVFFSFSFSFSGSGTMITSFPFGFGPGFLRGCPDAVSRVAGEVAFAGVGVLRCPTPTPPAETRMVEDGVPCSGECGGELKLPGEDASFASIVVYTETSKNQSVLQSHRFLQYRQCIELPVTTSTIRAHIAQTWACYVAGRWLAIRKLPKKL